MRVKVPGRGVTVVDDVCLYYDDNVLITATDAWTAVSVPLVPYAFRSHEDRYGVGWRSTLALAGMGEGGVRVKVVRRPFDPAGWAWRTGVEVARTGSPSASWPEHLARQAAQAASVQASTKHVIVLRRLGARNVLAQLNSRMARGWPAVGGGEIGYWWEKARVERDLLARGGFAAAPVDATELRWLRRHALSRGMTVAAPPVSGRSVWHKDAVESEFGDVTLTPLGRGVKVESESGTTYTATLVASAFPVEASHPESPPWLAHLDWVGPWVEADLSLELVPAKKAHRDVRARLRLTQDQRSEAAQAGSDLPIETEQMHALGRRVEADIPTMRRPLVYGWARFHVDASSEEELTHRVALLRERFAGEDSPHIDLSLPSGMAQVDLLMEGIPGHPVRHKSYRQRWTADTVACALPQAGSNLNHPTGAYVGWTTGRYLQAVTLDLHHGITRRSASDVEGPGGCVLFGAQRSGKSGALGILINESTERGDPTVVLDFSGPLARLAAMPRHAGRMQILDLTRAGAGVLDPMSPAVIPGDARTDTAVRENRKHLTRDTLHTIAYRQLDSDPRALADMLHAISEVAEQPRPRLAAVIDLMAQSPHPGTGALVEHLRFELGGASAEILMGDGDAAPADEGEPVTRIITAPGLPLPPAGVPMSEWQPAQALGAATFGIAAHLARRLLWGLPSWQKKLLVVDEAYIALGTESGRRVVQQALRDGPKHGVAVVLATHNARDFPDETYANAVATWLLFRSTSGAELGRAIELAGLEDTSGLRELIRGLRNGECVGRDGRDIRDRFQWDLYDPELKAVLNTTPSGSVVAASVNGHRPALVG